MLSLTELIAVVLVSASLATADCYRPDGVQQHAEYVSCIASRPDQAACCGGNRAVMASPHASDDVCLGNGLCATSGAGDNSTFYFRGGCSDRTWSSPLCLPTVCVGLGETDGNGMAAITPCDGTSTSETWCCGTSNTACCGKGMDGGEVTIARNILSTASSSSSPLAASSSSASASTSSQSNSNESASRTARTVAIGAGVGAGVGAAVILFVAIFASWKMRHRCNKMLLGGGGEGGSLGRQRSMIGPLYPHDSASQHHGYTTPPPPPLGPHGAASYVPSPILGSAHVDVATKLALSPSTQTVSPTELASDNHHCVEMPGDSSFEKSRI